MTHTSTTDLYSNHFPIRRTIFLNPNQLAILGENLNGYVTKSSRIADIIERYGLIISNSLPDFSDNEWLAICDHHQGVIMSTADIHGIDFTLFESAGELNHKWNIHTQDLAIRIRDMDILSKVAITEFNDRFWTWEGLENGSSNWHDIIKNIKESFKATLTHAQSMAPNTFSVLSMLDARECNNSDDGPAAES